MLGRRSLFLIGLGVGALALLAPTASADHQNDHGTVIGGVSTEAEATAFPCPTQPGGGYATTGPVVCVAKRAAVWNLTWDHNGYSCSYGPTGWSGNCLFDNDMGDHIKVWGTRGIPDTDFTVHWGHGASSSGGPAPGGGSSPPSGGGSGPYGPDSPEGPGSPDAPEYPDDPSYADPGYASPGSPELPDLPDDEMRALSPDGPAGIAPAGDDVAGSSGNGEGADEAAASPTSDDSSTSWVPIAIASLLLMGGAAAAFVVSRRQA